MITRFSEITLFDANTAWPQWNLTDFEFKKSFLLQAVNQLQKEAPELSAVMNFHLTMAEKQIAEARLMPGPTGETNELYAVGRGVCLLVLEPNSSPVAMLAQFTAALIAGNAVVLCSDDLVFNQQLEKAFNNAIPNHVIHIVAYDSYLSALQLNVSITGFVGTAIKELEINRLLSQKQQCIVPFVSEVIDGSEEGNEFITAHDPLLVLRFITERTRTINITAVGGNASLLELGNQH